MKTKKSKIMNRVMIKRINMNILTIGERSVVNNRSRLDNMPVGENDLALFIDDEIGSIIDIGSLRIKIVSGSDS
jgi:hypothetical protein